MVRVNALLVKVSTLLVKADVDLVFQTQTVALATTRQECVVSCRIRASDGDLAIARSDVELEALASRHQAVGRRV